MKLLKEVEDFGGLIFGSSEPYQWVPRFCIYVTHQTTWSFRSRLNGWLIHSIDSPTRIERVSHVQPMADAWPAHSWFLANAFLNRKEIWLSCLTYNPSLVTSLHSKASTQRHHTAIHATTVAYGLICYISWNYGDAGVSTTVSFWLGWMVEPKRAPEEPAKLLFALYQL